VDSDWAGDCSDRKSISGYAILMDGGAVSWGSKKQSCVTLSTVESEFITASAVVKEVIWIRLLFNSLVMPLTDPTCILTNNQGALDLIKSGQINDGTKHIETRFRHICDHKETGMIQAEYVATIEQVADIMTKSLGSEKFHYF